MTTIKAHTLSDFCRRYGIGRTKAYEEINAGRLKAKKNGRSTIITDEDAQAWLRGLPEMRTPDIPVPTPTPTPTAASGSWWTPDGAPASDDTKLPSGIVWSNRRAKGRARVSE
jgi:hypothetical protein